MSFEDKEAPRIIVALDYNNKEDAILMAKTLKPSLCKIKVGLELFITCGPSIIEEIHSLGYKIFLDLKFHDITNTVVNSCKVAAKMGVWMINVHSSGGKNMMLNSKKELINESYDTLVLGVTVLTSMQKNDINEIGFTNDIETQVLNMATLCKDSNLDGVVCSAQEAKLIKSNFPDNFLCVCPGIRSEDEQINDQKRIMTASMAAKNCVDYIVVGRPIIKSRNPLESLIKIKEEFDNGLKNYEK